MFLQMDQLFILHQQIIILLRIFKYYFLMPKLLAPLKNTLPKYKRSTFCLFILFIFLINSFKCYFFLKSNYFKIVGDFWKISFPFVHFSTQNKQMVVDLYIHSEKCY